MTNRTVMPEVFPGGGRESQPTVLVSGGVSELLAAVPQELFAARATGGDGAVVVTTREDPSVVARRLADEVEPFGPGRLALVDCTARRQADPLQRDGLRWSVRSPVAFDPLRRAVREALAELGDRGVDRTHFLFDTLASPFRLADGETALDAVHDVAMAVGGEDGLGVFAVERDAVTDDEAEQLGHLVDVDVEVRRGDDGAELRWAGLLGGSNGWVGLADASGGPVERNVG